MATSSKYEGGGAGGKFRKNQFRRQPTPYDRPSVFQAARQAFKSKLVDPASVIIARSAHSLFSSLFRKRLTAPPLVPEATRESRDEVQQANTISLGSGAQERVSTEPGNRSSGFGNNGIDEIEEALKQKTFTKAEIDRLTELLRSRTVNVPAENDKKRPDPITSHTEVAYGFQGHTNFPVQGNNMEIQRSLGGISAAAGNSSVLESDVAELAKAYMGSVPLNASPSNLGLRSPAASRRDVPLLTNVPYTPKSSGVSLAPMFAAGVSENGYTMPRARGRSAIYNMARTPNSRVHDTAARKTDGHFASSSSQWSLENNTLSNGKQALKRRSSILDSDIGSVGPIRRIRQKTNMMSPPKNSSLSTSRSPSSISGNADGSDIARGSRSVMHKQMFLNGSKDSISNMRLAVSGDKGILNSVSVPPRSSEMAEKILQQLDKLMPSPKEKLSELKLAVAREKSPAKLTHNMLHGKALRSLEDIDSSKLLKDDTSDGLDGSQFNEARDSTSEKQDKFDNGGRLLIAASNNKLAPKENGLETKASKEKVPSVKTSDSAIFSFAVRPSEKKRTFRMSAHEDFLDLDDDSDNGEVGVTDENEKPKKSAVDTEAITAKPGTSENHSIPSTESKSPTSSILKEGADSKVNVASPIAEKDSSFTFPVTSTSSTITQLTSPTPLAPLFSNGAAPPKEMTDAPIHSFGSKSVDKAGPFKFSSKSSGVNESSNLIFGAQSEPNFTQSSTATFAVTAAVTDTPKVLKSNESDNSTKSRDLFGHLENFVPSAASTSATMNIFSSGPFTNGPKMNEEPFSVSSRLPISPAQVSNGSSDVIFSAATSTSTTVAATNTSTSASTTVSTTTSNPSIAAITPTSSAASLFKFGSNSVTVPSNLSASGIESTHSELKDKMSPSFGSLTNSPFGASSSSGFTSMSSGIFGFGASTTSSTSNLSFSSSNQSLSSNPFGTAVGSPFGAQGDSAETKTGSLPNPFGLSASSSTLGHSASSSPSAGSSLFGSSSGFGLSSSTSMGASSGFGPSSSTSMGATSGFGLSSSTSVGASSFTSSSGTGLFGSSLPSGTSSIFSSGFGSATSTPVFSFGATSAASPSPAASAPMVFGSSLGSSSAPIFPFAPAAPTTTSASLPPSSSVFGTPSSVVQFGSTSHSNDQMSMEDSMAEDTVQASNSVVTAFGQPANSAPSGNFIFGSGAPSGASPFQFGSQQSLGTPQNLSPFQAAGNLEFSAGSSFSLGTGGGDKANRKIVRVKRDKLRKR